MLNQTTNTTLKQVQLPQGTICYREYGGGEPIVFIHGALFNGHLWRKVVPLLAPHFRCIVPDWPLGGHTLPLRHDADLTLPGLAQLVADFLTALKLEDVTLVGNDTGGAICQVVITQHPKRIARLVLTNCDAFENFPPPMFQSLKWGAYLPGFVWLLAQLMKARALQRLPMTFGWLSKRPIPPEVMDDYFSPLQHNRLIRRDTAKLLRGISTRYTIAAAQSFEEVTQPVLLAWAVEDRFFTFAYAERIAALLPDAQLERITDSYTFVPEDQPERLAKLVLHFMHERNAIAT